MSLEFELPFPPTVNTYWRYVGGSPRVSKKGRKYKSVVKDLVWLQRTTHPFEPFDPSKRLSAALRFYPPDERKRDIDNLSKAPFDALEEAGVFADDSQFDLILLSRHEIHKPKGRLVVVICEL